MKNENNILQNFSLGILIVGFLIYVAVDSNLMSGLFRSWDKISWGSSPSAESVEFSQKSQELETKISGAIEELQEKKKNLLQTTETIKNLEQKLRKEKQEVVQLNQLYKKLQKEKEALWKDHENLKEALGTRKVAAVEKSNMATEISLDQLLREVSQIENWNQVHEQLQKENKEPVQFETHRESDRDVLRFSHTKPFDDDSIYLRPTGIRFSRLIAASALSLGAQGLQVSYSKEADDSIVEEKAKVVEKYLKKLVGKQIPVRRKEVKETQGLGKDEVELWVDLDSTEKPRSNE
jgi:myosin heavy subunit